MVYVNGAFVCAGIGDVAGSPPVLIRSQAD